MTKVRGCRSESSKLISFQMGKDRICEGNDSQLYAVTDRRDRRPFLASYSSGVSSNLSTAERSVNSPGLAEGSMFST